MTPTQNSATPGMQVAIVCSGGPRALEQDLISKLEKAAHEHGHQVVITDGSFSVPSEGLMEKLTAEQKEKILILGIGPARTLDVELDEIAISLKESPAPKGPSGGSVKNLRFQGKYVQERKLQSMKARRRL